jgi:UDP-GlcNAc3NAcA epimerase
MTGYQLSEIEKILIKESPSWVILFGDTNSTLAGALAASKLHIPIAHIESGLRSFNMKMPEEINRIITDRLSTLLFCPTQRAVNNLIKEGFNNFNCHFKIVGDIMFDALKLFSGSLKQDKLNIPPYALCTLHRAENIDNDKRLKTLCETLNTISEELQIIFPLHPRTKKRIIEKNIELNHNIKVIGPLPYIEFINYIKNSELVISDSGGIQKEAYFLKKNCIVLREETEWVELIERNNNILAGVFKNDIIEAFNSRKLLNQDFSSKIYGSGTTSKLILESILKFKN